MSMRGTFRGEERRTVSSAFRQNHVPHFVVHEIEPLGKFLYPKPEITALDVGANKGLWAKALLTRFGTRVRHIYMVDASAENFKELTNREDNLVFDPEDFALLTQMHLAVGETSGEVSFYTNDDGSPIGSVFPHTVAGEHTLDGMGRLTEISTVPLQTIDNIMAIRGIDHLDVVKLDVEGNELNAILGAEKAIRDNRIDVIMFEFGCHQVDAGHFFRDFYKFFKKAGWSMHKIDGLHLYDIPEYGYYLENLTECWNFVASRI